MFHLSYGSDNLGIELKLLLHYGLLEALGFFCLVQNLQEVHLLLNQETRQNYKNSINNSKWKLL